MAASRSVFISYRREMGGLWALALYQQLKDRGVDAYYDIESGQALGQFDTRILNQIAARPYFLLVLTPGTLDRCPRQGDWLWREIEHALATDRIIVPMLTPKFDFADADRYLPNAAAERLRAFNGLELSQTWFSEAVRRLTDELLVPTSIGDAPISPEDDARAQSIAALVAETPTVTPDQLAAQEEYERRLAEPAARSTSPGVPPEPPSEPIQRRRYIAILAAVVVAAVIAVVAAVALTRGGDDGGAGGEATEPAPPRTTSSDGEISDRLEPDDVMVVGDSRQSPNGRHVLEMTAAGLELTSGSSPPLALYNEPETLTAVAVMQSDGNFVVYPNEERLLGTHFYSSDTANDGGVSLVVDNTGQVSVMRADGTTVEQLPFRRPNGDESADSDPVDSTDGPESTDATNPSTSTTSSPSTTTSTTTTTTEP